MRIVLRQFFVKILQGGSRQSFVIVRGIVSDGLIGIQSRRDILKSSGIGAMLGYRLEEQQRLVWCVGGCRRHTIVGKYIVYVRPSDVAVQHGGVIDAATRRLERQSRYRN